MGSTFEQTRKRWKNIEIGEEIIELIQEMKNEEFNMRPSIDKILERMILYCDEKNYSESIEIVGYLKQKKIFLQTFFNEEDFSKINFLELK